MSLVSTCAFQAYATRRAKTMQVPIYPYVHLNTVRPTLRVGKREAFSTRTFCGSAKMDFVWISKVLCWILTLRSFASFFIGIGGGCDSFPFAAFPQPLMKSKSFSLSVWNTGQIDGLYLRNCDFRSLYTLCKSQASIISIIL